ncbi:MAG: hypothetical protein KJ970_00435 [Candidatus Eisenbacteria bacterium]|uniref:Methylamine utilisation protein MauE domain-containing protein n=1 Tax=Eiseniibacteriota bacterium TaxID=2212470 RepID=A0A948W599_UNCEI|nr:hypothetical protein [Candidatus Eisenbacteria bacterium]MBU1949153.1 hypothetical protein [Candidatus Eisenbacteria bacterium]MBU2689366.1 hypothetical protein [Candidatus Eisenbacteria bacterium]
MKFPVRTWFAYLLAWVPIVAFAVAGFLKGADPLLFSQQITEHGVSPAAWSPVLSYVFIAIELLLALALVLWIAPRPALFLSGGLLFFFIAVTAVAWSMGKGEACGCFGRLSDRGPEAVIKEDTLLIAATALAFFLAPRKRPTGAGGRTILLLVLAIPALAYTALGQNLPLDGLITGIRPGTDLSDISLDGLRQPVGQGRVLLVLAEPECPVCDEAFSDLKAIAGPDTGVRVVYTIQGDSKTASQWRLRHLPPFPVGRASKRVLRQYYRRLPCAFLLQDGVVVQAYWNRLPILTDLPAPVAASS